MSGTSHYEFAAVDRPIDDRVEAATWSLSTRSQTDGVLLSTGISAYGHVIVSPAAGL